MSNKQIALVTGAADAIGSAICRQLAKDGFALAVCDKDEAAVKSLGDELGPDVLVLADDVSTEDGASRIFSAVDRKFGRIDLLVNNNGEFCSDTFEELTADRLREVFKSAVIADMLCTKKAAEIMEREKIQGKIINASTDNAFVSEKDRFSASTVSWALRGTTRATAKQLSKLGIRVNSYCTGNVPPEAVADFVSYLASTDNEDTTGQNIMINDGRYMD